jgi:signal transduction histidine kinase
VTTRLLRALWIALALAFSAALVSTWRGIVDALGEEGYERHVRVLPGIDARLNEHVLRARLGLVTSYDPIVATMTELAQTHEALQVIPRSMSAAAVADLRARVTASVTALAERERAVEGFKTENAVLRNSLRFFPVAAVELADRARATGASEVAARLDELLGSVLLFNLVPDPEILPRVQRDIAALRATEQGRNAALADEVAVLLAHAETILARKPRVDRLANEIADPSTRARSGGLQAAWSLHRKASAARGENLRLASFLLALGAVVALSFDVVMRTRRAAAQLREATEKLEAVNAALQKEKEKEREIATMKSRFVAMTSHEFRTPLSVVMSSADLLEAYADRWSEDKKREHFVRITAAVKGMTAMLDRILLIGRAEARMLELRVAPVRVDAFCRDLVTTLDGVEEKRRIDYSFEGDPGEALLDTKLLGHVLSNLLSNATKYSPDGAKVDLLVARRREDVLFQVRDRGIGIPEADQARLFETFHRASNVGNVAGTGLGLAVVKASVEVHGGRISVESEEGKGTTFSVVIPVGGLS